MMNPEMKVITSFNFYQPTRGAEHAALRGIPTSLDGIDHSERIAQSCYDKLVHGRFGNAFGDFSYNLYPTLEIEFERILAKQQQPGEDQQGFTDRQASIRATREGMHVYLAENGVASTGIHTMIPDQKPRVYKRTLIRAGNDQFMRNSGGRRPRWLWLPELGWDLDTAEAARDEQIEGLICAPWQVRLDSGEAADNQPVRLPLPSGRSIVALPFSRRLHDAISWGKDRWNADIFADTHVMPAFDWAAANHNSHRLNVMVSDGETLGGHNGTEGVDQTMQYLLRVSLPERGVQPIPINQLDLSDLPTGTLVERTAWSCEHGDLKRWKEPCGCHAHEASPEQLVWKVQFSKAHSQLNERVLAAVRETIDMSDEKFIDEVGGSFFSLLQNPGGSSSDTQTSALSAIPSGFAATTSCGTFFKAPRTSGYINMLFAAQAVYHLRDVGLVEPAEEIWGEYMKNMSQLIDPETGKSGDIMVEDLLNGRLGMQESADMPLAA